MTRSMLRDALSALAAVTLASTAAGGPASAQGARNPNRQDWRWWQDYGGGK